MPSKEPGVIEEAVARIRAWGEARRWQGFDPYDALSSPLTPVLSLGTPLGRRLLTQAVKLSPLNLRSALRIPADWNPKAVALVASAYARLWAATGEMEARRQAEQWLSWLDRRHTGDASGHAWGYNFDVQTRFFAYAAGTPNTIATTFAGQAFLDAAELFDDARWRAPAVSAARYLEENMLAPEGYFRYVAKETELVHNANLLACALLTRAGREHSAAEALATSLRSQRGDGSWPYAEGPRGQWVDNFHTAYVLESLARCESAFPQIGPSLRRGLDFWERELFQADGTPKPDLRHDWPIDAHCYASAIDAWVAAGRLEPAVRTAHLLIDRMLDASGYVWFERRRYWTNRVPFVRWTTAPTFRALAGVMLAEQSSARLDRPG